ncbi:MAG: guanylate kinase, partial [Sandarakinorhabdus sp.]|nr:guanylate kinase [Sandarakinorhabdus sp.]
MTEFARPASRPPRRGLMFVLSSPSGAGKTTLSRRLLTDDPDITLSVSATTRSPRSGEIDGRDYWFVAADRFAAMVQGDDLLEWATGFGNR